MPETVVATPAAQPAKTTPAQKTPAATPNGAQAPAAKPGEEATELIKVNGKEYKVTPSQLRALAQRAYAADERIKSADVLRDKTQNLLKAMRTPEGLMQILNDPALGASPKDVFRKMMASDFIDGELREEISRWVYDNVVQKAKLSPEEIERDKKLSDYERLKKAEEERKQKDALAQQQSQVQQVYQAVRAEVTKQILADKTFPQTEGSIRSVVEKLRVMNSKGIAVNPQTVTKAIELVKKDHLVHQQTMFDSIEDAEALIAFLGEPRALKISRALVERLRSKGKVKTAEAKSEAGETIREKVTDRIDKKLGRTPQGFTILDV